MCNSFCTLKEKYFISYIDGIVSVIDILISYVDALSTSSIKTFSTIDVNIAQVILEVVIIIAIMLEKVQNFSMRRFMNILLAALWFETFLISSYAYILHGMVHIRLAIFVWELYKLVRLLVSLSLCSPMIVFTKKQIKLHIIFLLLSSIIIGGAIVNWTKSSPEKLSGYNNIAFMLIFLFTLYQYHQLKSHMHDDEGDIKGLKSLMAIEMILILLNGLLLILFFSSTNHLLQSLRLSITLVQYLKIHMIMSLFASLRVSVEPPHHI
jgi:hypothetical protein